MSRTQTVTPTRELTGRTPVRLRQNGAAIRCLREKDGWHQPEFARKVGMSQAALSNIEGKRNDRKPSNPPEQRPADPGGGRRSVSGRSQDRDQVGEVRQAQLDSHSGRSPALPGI